MAFLKRILSTLAALAVAGAAIVGIVTYLTQLSWAANPLREQLNTEALPDDLWALSVGERQAISEQLTGVVYTDAETGQIKWLSASGLEGWTVCEPLRDYVYTGSALVQRPRWYYPVCYGDTVYVVITAKANDLPEGTDPVPSAGECEWSWELVRDESGQVLPGWYALNMASAGGDNDFAVINTEDYALLYTNGSACGMAMWENTVHTQAGTTSDFSFQTPGLLDNVEVADVYNAYPLV